MHTGAYRLLTRLGAWLLLAIVLLAGCSTAQLPSRTGDAQPTPTMAGVFERPALVTPVASPARPELPMPPRSADPDEQFEEIVIYDDDLRAGWSLEQSAGMRYNIAAPGVAHSGSLAAAITPIEPEGEFFLTVDQSSRELYRRDQVLGVSFWLSGGRGPINTDDLAMAVVGSNDYTYWVEDDPSVQFDGRVTEADPELFSPTRLYYLGINRAIPPSTWVEAINWLDRRIYDVDYTYITGIYIRNKSNFFDTFYIDRIVLLVQR